MNETNLENKKVHLEVLLNELSNSITSTDRPYFHLQTIENLIFHFDEIKTENDKNWVYHGLVSYFTKCAEIVPSIDRETSTHIYDEYIDNITDYYHKHLGFSMLTNRSIVYVIYFIVLILCYVFLNWYAVLFAASFFILMIFKMFKKNKEKKVYSLYW
jgi:hypothetical protein